MTLLKEIFHKSSFWVNVDFVGFDMFNRRFAASNGRERGPIVIPFEGDGLLQLMSFRDRGANSTLNSVYLRST